jgi:NTP pyrophosphatase (non-canonical NTP hydrolase)
MENINKLISAAHANAVSKGWWEEDRSFGEIIALIHSEVSEALEDYRNGRQPFESWYKLEDKIGCVVITQAQFTPHYKPCGIPSEMADVCIRIFDIAGRKDWGSSMQEEWEEDLFPLIEKGYAFAKSELEAWFVDASFPEKLAFLHEVLSKANERHRELDFVSAKDELTGALFFVWYICQENNIDLEAAIAEKMAYNTTRPQRHGGKVI